MSGEKHIWIFFFTFAMLPWHYSLASGQPTDDELTTSRRHEKTSEVTPSTAGKQIRFLLKGGHLIFPSSSLTGISQVDSDKLISGVIVPNILSTCPLVCIRIAKFDLVVGIVVCTGGDFIRFRREDTGKLLFKFKLLQLDDRRENPAQWKSQLRFRIMKRIRENPAQCKSQLRLRIMKDSLLYSSRDHDIVYRGISFESELTMYDVSYSFDWTIETWFRDEQDQFVLSCVG